MDLSSEESVKNIDHHYRRIFGFHPMRNIVVVLVGNKNEKERVIS